MSKARIKGLLSNYDTMNGVTSQYIHLTSFKLKSQSRIPRSFAAPFHENKNVI